MNHENVKSSSFLKDIFTTGFSQVGVLLFGVVLLKLMAAAFSPTHFGLFNIVRRWEMVVIPLLTLNLSVGLTRFVSYERENATFYLHFTLIASSLICIISLPVLFMFPDLFSKLLYDQPGYGTLVILLALFMVANILHLISYSYFRGKMDMKAVNTMRTYFFAFPLLPAAIALFFKYKTGQPASLLYLHLFFLLYTVFGVLLSLGYLRKELSLSCSLEMFKDKWVSIRQTIIKSRDLLSYSLYRIPGVFFIALIFGFPVLYAGHVTTLEEAGYVGIVVSVLRLLEIFSMPFNMIFLPKFSGLLRDQETSRIHAYCSVVLDFIFTFLPFCGVLLFGVIPFFVRIWFGPQYMTAAPSLALTVLITFFYLAFALIRGILDGLFSFPYTNIITCAGFIVNALLSIFIGVNTLTLSIAFSAGLVTLGLFAIYVLVKKLQLSFPVGTVARAIIIATLLFMLLYLGDSYLTQLQLSHLLLFAMQASVRMFLILPLWFFYWRKTIWYQEIIKRLKIRGQKLQNE